VKKTILIYGLLGGVLVAVLKLARPFVHCTESEDLSSNSAGGDRNDQISIT